MNMMQLGPMMNGGPNGGGGPPPGSMPMPIHHPHHFFPHASQQHPGMQMMGAGAHQPPPPPSQQQPPAPPVTSSMNRSQRCGVCRGCQCKPCGQCTYCQDSPQFGGPGVKKQSCIERRCLRVLENRLQRDAPTFKARIGCNQCEDCRMPDCQICLVCLDKRFFENRYMRGAMCAKKRCNSAQSLDCGPNDFNSQRVAQKRSYEQMAPPPMHFDMKRMQYMGSQQSQQQSQVLIAQLAPRPQSSHQQPGPSPPRQQSQQSPPTTNNHQGAPQATNEQDAQQHQRLIYSNGYPEMNSLHARLLPPTTQPTIPCSQPSGPSQTPPIPSVGVQPPTPAPAPPPPPPSQPSHGIDVPYLIPTSIPVSFAPIADFYPTKYGMDEFERNGDPFVPPSYAPDMKNAVILQPL